MLEPIRISTGLEGLDTAIDELRQGENVVWQINNLADYMYAANRFVMNIAREGKRIVYFRFGEHDEVVDAEGLSAGGANAKKYELDAHIGFESFTVLMHRIIQREGRGVFYVFDCLTELQKFWFSDLMVSNFFLLTNAYLSEMSSIGYFPIMFKSHTYETISRIRHAAPVLVNMRTHDGALYLHAVNVRGRLTPATYYPVRLRDGKWDMLTSSVDNIGLFEQFVQVGEQRDCWDKMFDAVSAGEHDEAQDYLEVAPQIQERLLNGRFNKQIREQFLSMLEYFGQSPIIVRSSSLLEDGFGNAFAGKYDSVFCANQGSLEDRYAVFEQAVRTVYASTMNQDAIQYRAERGLLEHDEQMALLVMRVSGDCHGRYYYPHMGGVGHSKNLYINHSNIGRENKGMLRLVFGMGTRAVDREADDYARLISLDNPRAPLLCSYGDEYRYSQHSVDVIDLEENAFVTIPATTIQRRDVKADMALFTEADLATIARFRELGIRETPPEIFSFKKLLWQTDFTQAMTHMLTLLAEKYNYPVDIEYACNFRPGPGADYRINLLQCRPLQTKGVGSASRAPAVKTKLFDIRGNFMGGNMCQPVRYIVHVEARPYLDLTPQLKYQTARTIGTLNTLLRGKDAVLMGPGRWGTSTISLGVPVNFMEICHFFAVSEVSYNERGLVPELSYGSHFFQDLVEAGTFYTALNQEEEECEYHAEALQALPNCFARLVPEAAGTPLEGVVHVYDLSGRGAILFAEVESQACFLGWN